MNPAAQGLAWSTTGGTLVGSTYTGTAAGGPYKVKVQSVEDPTKVAEASVMVQSVSVAVPTTSIPVDQLFVGTPLTCSALVSGASVSTVTWSITGGQTIHPSTGLFTPTAPGSYTVTATSTCDPTKSASALLVVKALQVAVSPAQATVKSGQTQAFTATVTGYGSPSQAVTWRVDGVVGGNSTVGTISASGVYTAPAASGDHVISAVSQQDPAGLGSATLRVPGWKLKWVKDIVYVGTKEVAEVSPTGTQIAFVDHLGSPRYLWDGQPPAANQPDGVHLLEQKFMPFGESLTHPADASKIAKGFTNHEQTEASGLIYMQARFYAPWFGRFLSPDPARDQHFEETQSWNIYSYVQNDPMMKIDPTGMVVEGKKKKAKTSKAKPIKDKIKQVQVYRNGDKAKAVFGETRGLHPKKGDKESAKQFKKMQIDIGEVSTRGERHQEADGSEAKEAPNKAAWKDAKEAAAGKSDLPPEVIHFHMRQDGGSNQTPDYLRNKDGDLKKPVRTYGPFDASGRINVKDSKADIGKTYIDFYDKGKTPEREN